MVFILVASIVVFFIIVYQRATGIITVNPLHGARPMAVRPDEDDDIDEDDGEGAPDFAGLLNTIREAAQPAEGRGRAAILTLVQNNQFIEAVKLYRGIYGVDLQTAKKAVDAMRAER